MLIRVAHRGPALAAMLVVVTACGLPGFDGTTRSAAHPGIEIRCDGGRPIPADVCVAWAEQSLSSNSLGMDPLTNRIDITFRGGDDGSLCSSAFHQVHRGRVATVGFTCPVGETPAPP